MFVAAMLSAAFKLESVKEIINAGLAEIPENCRLTEAVKDTMHWCETLPTWELVWEKINESVGHYHGVHTINNAALVVMGLFFGENDFEKGQAECTFGVYNSPQMVYNTNYNMKINGDTK